MGVPNYIYPVALLCFSLSLTPTLTRHVSGVRNIAAPSSSTPPPFPPSSSSTPPPQPFLTVWNAPTALCRSRYGVDLDLEVFDIVQNRDGSFMGDNMTIFYRDRLGLYPRYTRGEPVCGGTPQNASLGDHLRRATEDIRQDIPDRAFQGLAVVDWEDWRPLWERNWDSKAVYWDASRALVRARHPDWNPAQVEVKARTEFQKAGRDFMEETLRLGQTARPGGLWGFYGFPLCYNYYKSGSNYTGECPPAEVKRNDQLFWLWNVSSALYPDMYLDMEMRGLGEEVRLYAHHRVLEALRASAQATPTPPPVIMYARVVYTYSLEFLSQADLAHTIGESAALGAAGVVMWGDSMYAKSKASCEAVKSYVDETLGRYLVNVTSAATLCSRTLCSSRGRCRRKDPGSGAYLHLDPQAWTVLREERRPRGGYRVVGRLGRREAGDMQERFQCQCYPGWSGERCSDGAAR